MEETSKKLISVIVPCYNEQDVLTMFYKEIIKVSDEMKMKFPEVCFEYLFIDDGSRDRTLEILRALSKCDSRVRYISFSRNFGKEAGIYAGLKNAKGDYCVVMDADLQHPPAFLPQMYEAVSSGFYDCATTRRISRDGESKVRSWFARLFYKIMNRISQTEIVDGAQDFRFMTRQMVDAVLSMSEYNRFSKGIFSWVGFRVKYLEYKNVERAAGTSAWSFWGLFRYSIEGMLGFSTAPLAAAVVLGILTCLAAVIMLIVEMVRGSAVGDAIVLFVGGLQLICTGIIGIYLGKTYLEVKSRPIYIARETEENTDMFLDPIDEQRMRMELEACEENAYDEDESLFEDEEYYDEDDSLTEERNEILERAQRLKAEADEEFDAIVDAAMEQDADEEEETSAYDDMDYDEADDGEPDAPAEAAEETFYDAEASEPEDVAAPSQKKGKLEVKIDYDSVSYDDDEEYDEEYYDDDEYGDEYYDDEEYYDDAEYDDEYYDEEAYDDDAVMAQRNGIIIKDESVGGVQAFLLLLKEKFAALIDRLNTDKTTEAMEAALEEEYDAESYDEAYDDYDEEYDEAYDEEYDEAYDEEYDAEYDELYDEADDYEDAPPAKNDKHRRPHS